MPVNALGKPRNGEQTLAGVLIHRHIIILGGVTIGSASYRTLKERHKEEMDGVRKTLEENTSVLSSLKELIQIIINKDK